MKNSVQELFASVSGRETSCVPATGKHFNQNSSTVETSSLNYKGQSRSQYYISIKRIMDIVLSTIGLILSLPMLLVSALAVKLETGGPVFYFQERVGINGRNFFIIKLRSMHVNAEKNGAQWAQKKDPRVTHVGKFIRLTRIDEIPQLINVLKGEMSLIGPRPERPIFTAQFSKEIPGFISRLQVKPGITGWAQINGGYEISPKEKLELDLFYIRNMSVRLDLYILFKTVIVVLTGNGAR